MAKTNKKVDNTSVLAHGAIEMKVATKEDKKEKAGGKQHELESAHLIPGYRKPLQAGSKFIECNDGWYQVYDSRGIRTCYRVSPEVVKKVFGAELVAKI